MWGMVAGKLSLPPHAIKYRALYWLKIPAHLLLYCSSMGRRFAGMVRWWSLMQASLLRRQS